MFLDAPSTGELETWITTHYSRKHIQTIPHANIHSTISETKKKPYVHKIVPKRRQLRSYKSIGHSSKEEEDEDVAQAARYLDEYQSSYWLQFSEELNFPVSSDIQLEEKPAIPRNTGFEEDSIIGSSGEDPIDDSENSISIEEDPDDSDTYAEEQKLTRAEQVMQNRFFNREYTETKKYRTPIGSSPLRNLRAWSSEHEK